MDHFQGGIVFWVEINASPPFLVTWDAISHSKSHTPNNRYGFSLLICVQILEWYDFEMEEILPIFLAGITHNLYPFDQGLLYPFFRKKYFIWFNSVSGIGLIYVYISLWCFVWLADGWCWFAVREKYCWLASGWCWFGVREKHCCWLLTERKGTIVMST